MDKGNGQSGSAPLAERAKRSWRLRGRYDEQRSKSGRGVRVCVWQAVGALPASRRPWGCVGGLAPSSLVGGTQVQLVSYSAPGTAGGRQKPVARTVGSNVVEWETRDEAEQTGISGEAERGSTSRRCGWVWLTGGWWTGPEGGRRGRQQLARLRLLVVEVGATVSSMRSVSAARVCAVSSAMGCVHWRGAVKRCLHKFS